jgi:putative transposase
MLKCSRNESGLKGEVRKKKSAFTKTLFVDHGPEFTSSALDVWAHRHGMQLACSRPGTPTDNPFIEAFNARIREECLNQHWFVSMEEARTTIEAWRMEYDIERPHTALRH